MARADLATDAVPQLLIPPPAVARHPDTLSSPNDLANWLAELPLADSEHQAELLHRQIKLQVRDPNPSKHYAALIKAFHPASQALQSNVWHALTQDKGKRKIQEKLLSNVSKLMLELACGHMRCINLALEKGQQPAATDIYHALLPLVRLLQWDILRYNLTRPSLWRQLLQLYAMANLFECNADKVESQLALDMDGSNTHDLFFSTLALLLADPYRLPSGALGRLCSGMSKLASYLRYSNSEKAHYRVPVDLSGQLPPLRYARQQTNSPQTAYLQLDEFLSHLSQQGLPNDDGSLALWLRDSLLQLSARDRGQDGRRHQRQTRIADYRFHGSLRDVQNRLREIQLGSTPSTHETAGIVLEEEATQALLTLGIPCRQIDHSSSGARFLLGNPKNAPDIGDWLLFETESTKGAQGFVARVQRRLRLDNAQFELGVEKLQGTLIPVLVGHQQTPGLLNADRNSGLIQLILASEHTEQPKVLVLHGAQKDYQVENCELLEQGNGCIRLRVELL